MIHGDDFIAVGDRAEIATFRKLIANRFTVKDKVVGLRSDLGETRETRILNRIIRVTTEGWEYEADQRHADMIVQEMGLTKANSVKTPGEDEPSWKWKTMTRLWTKGWSLSSGQSRREPTTWQQTEWTYSSPSKSAAGEWRHQRSSTGTG